MEKSWNAFWQDRRKWLKTGWLITAVLLAVYGGVIRPLRAFRGIAMEKTTALAAIERNRHWLVPLPQSVDNATLAAGVIGGVPGGAGSRSAPTMTYLSTSDGLADRKLVRTSSIDLLVKRPAESAEKIRSLAERVGGFLVKSQMNGAQDATSAWLTIRVPAARIAEVGAEIRKLGLRVESEQMEAQDVTKQYVDQQAHLRNLRAQEAQYLTILKQAKTVKDTLDVSEKLNGVRGEIEQQEAEFEALSKQVETVAITVSLHSEAGANVFGLHWRPSYELKLAVMQGLEGLADYATAMFSFVFYLPAILLWLTTILVAAALGWKALRLGVRVLLAGKKPAHVPA
ncbi:MAG TPA: DUF4349 domain-containing protein [Terriglobales bacterium]|nr:DUF4349 domain-containing protein [Terriglobales bacterium]